MLSESFLDAILVQKGGRYEKSPKTSLKLLIEVLKLLNECVKLIERLFN